MLAFQAAIFQSGGPPGFNLPRFDADSRLEAAKLAKGPGSGLKRSTFTTRGLATIPVGGAYMGAGSSTAPGYDSDTEFGQIDPEISFDDTAPLDPPPQPLTQNQENELDKLCQEISSKLSTIAKKVSNYLHFFAKSPCRTLYQTNSSRFGESWRV